MCIRDRTVTELGYLDGVTSNIQAQIDAKGVTITGSATTIDTETLTSTSCLLYTSPSPRDAHESRMPSSA